jgi:hypothetical protein
MKSWQRVALGVVLGVGVGVVVWRLAPNGQRAIPVLTGVLIAITAWYADRTHEMVREMRAARAAQLRPKLVVTMDKFAARAITPRVVSVGAGAAFDVNVRVTLEPNGPSGPFVASVLSVGRGQSLIFREQATNKVLASVDEFKSYERVHLTGSCADALGERMKVDETLDLSAYMAAYEEGLWKTPGGTKRGKEPLEAIEEILDLIEHHIRLMVQPQ